MIPFPTILPVDAIQVLISAVEGHPHNGDTMLAGWNVVGYGLGQIDPATSMTPNIVLTTRAMTLSQLRAAAAGGRVNWLQLLSGLGKALPIILPILQGILGNAMNASDGQPTTLPGQEVASIAPTSSKTFPTA